MRWLLGLIVVAVTWAVITGQPIAHSLMSKAQRDQLDLSRYSVRKPGAGMFDRDRRRNWLTQSADPDIRAAADRVPRPACRDLLERPVVDFTLRMPPFYLSPNEWRQAIRPLFAFEDGITDLAAADMLLGDPYYGNCLIGLLDKWASQGALLKFHYGSKTKQAWYNTEDMLFSAGQAYALVRGRYPELASAEARIDDWLKRASRNHISWPGGPDSCCNNHFYRRALHAAIIGVTTGADDLFQFGVSALYSALHEMRPDGGLPRELERPGRAIHYQNYALQYLVLIAEIVERQGYTAYGLEIGGRRLADAVNFFVGLVHDSAKYGYDPRGQYLGFMTDPQYFAWAEIWLSRFRNEALTQMVEPLRPIVNRSAVGHATLYFFKVPN